MMDSESECTDCQLLDPIPTNSDLQLGLPFSQHQLIDGLGSVDPIGRGVPIGIPRSIILTGPLRTQEALQGSKKRLCIICEKPFCAYHLVQRSRKCIYCLADGEREADKEHIKSLLFAFGKRHYQIWPSDHLEVRKLIIQSLHRRGNEPDWRNGRIIMINSLIITENKIKLRNRFHPEGLSAYEVYSEGLEIAKAADYATELVRNDSEFDNMCEYYLYSPSRSNNDVMGRLKSALKTGVNKWERALLYDIKTGHRHMTWYRILILSNFFGLTAYDEQEYMEFENDPNRRNDRL